MRQNLSNSDAEIRCEFCEPRYSMSIRQTCQRIERCDRCGGRSRPSKFQRHCGRDSNMPMCLLRFLRVDRSLAVVRWGPLRVHFQHRRRAPRLGCFPPPIAPPVPDRLISLSLYFLPFSRIRYMGSQILPAGFRAVSPEAARLVAPQEYRALLAGPFRESVGRPRN